MKISIVVAVAENSVIGNNNMMPWHSKEDLRHFKELTTGHHILMGRNTFNSIGKPLPNRTNTVLSRDDNLKIEGVKIFQELGQAIKFAEEQKENELFVIGGQQVYELTLPLAEKIYQTLILEKHEGNAFFPNIPEDAWRETSRDEQLELNPPIIFRTLERR